MIRVVVVVAAAIALLAAAAPVVADARVQSTDDRIAIQGERIGATAADLVSESTAVADPTLAARRSVSIRLPTGFTAAPVEDAELTCQEGAAATARGEATSGDTAIAACDAVISYRIAGHPRRSAPVPGVAVAVPAESIPLSAGATRLTLRLVTGTDEPVVTVQRA